MGTDCEARIEPQHTGGGSTRQISGENIRALETITRDETKYPVDGGTKAVIGLDLLVDVPE